MVSSLFFFSVPSYRSEWFWWFWQGAPHPDVVKFVQKSYPPDITYGDLAAQFKAELFDPKQWAQLFKNAGAR